MYATKGHRNSLNALGKYFLGLDTHTNAGRDMFFEFWKSLTIDERDYYRSLDLETGLPCVDPRCSFRHI